MLRHSYVYKQNSQLNALKGITPRRGAASYSDFPCTTECVIIEMADLVIGKNKYNWTALEEGLNEVKSYGRQSMVWFHMDWPGSNSKDAIPKYLLDVGVVASRYDSGSGVGYSPDYNDQRVWDMAFEFVDALAKIYDGDPRIMQIEASIVGFWGEWHTHPFKFGITDEKLSLLAARYDNAFSKTQISCRYPAPGTANMNVGYSDYSFAYETLNVEWSQLKRLESFGATQYWKKAMGGGEIYPGLNSDIFKTSELKTPFSEPWNDCLQALHPTWMLYGHVAGLNGESRKNAITASMMFGYDLTVTQSSFESEIASNVEFLNLEVNVKNLGIAPFYYPWEVQCGLMNSKGVIMKRYSTDWDLTTVAADATEYTFKGALREINLTKGTYQLAIKVINPMSEGYPLLFSNESQRQDGWMILGTIDVDYNNSAVDMALDWDTGRDLLTSPYSKYNIDITANIYKKKILVNSNFMYGVRIRNFSQTSYTGSEKMILNIYKNGALVKAITTDWLANKLTLDSNNYFAWTIQGLEVGDYVLKVKIAKNTTDVTGATFSVVATSDELGEITPLLKLSEYVEEPEEPEKPEKPEASELVNYYNNFSVKQYEFISTMVVGTPCQIGVRFTNNNSSYRNEEYFIKLLVYKRDELIRASITDWKTSKMVAGGSQYFMWGLNNLTIGSYTLFAQMMEQSKLLKISDFTIKASQVDPEEPEEPIPQISPIYDDIIKLVKDYINTFIDTDDKNTATQLVAGELETIAEEIREGMEEEPTDPGGSNPGNPPESTYNVVTYGAVAGDGKSDIDAFTRCFNAAGSKTVSIPTGTFNLPWTTSSTFNYNRLLSCTGSGRISIDDFPQPGNRKTGFNPNLINPLYEDGFGRFDMSDVTDDVFMSMNMLHEHRSVMDMYHQNYAAVKSRHNPSSTHPKLVPWGQCALRLDKRVGALPSGNVTFNIGKFGVMIYRKSTKRWEFESNPFAAGGGFFLKSYDGTTIALTRTTNKSVGYVSFTVPISRTADYVVHFWSPGWVVNNPIDIQYAIVFGDVWLDNKTPYLIDYFVFNLGLDMKTTNNESIHEFITGRFIDITYQKRRNYVHNIMEADYNAVTGGGYNINKLIDAKSYIVNY